MLTARSAESRPRPGSLRACSRASRAARHGQILVWPLLLALSLGGASTARAQFGPSTQAEPSGFKKFTSSISNGFKKTFSKKDKKTAPVVDEHDPLALSNKPKHIDAEFYVSLARLQEQAGATDAAIEQYQNALKENKQHLPAMMGLAHIYEEKRQPQKALEIYQRAAKSHANEASVFNDMGLCYRQVGKLDEAIAAQQQAVELQPGRKLYRNNLATTLVRAGRGNEALDQLLAVHRPPTAHYNIGYLLNEQGDRDAARFHFQRALEFDPTFAPAQQWLAVLPPPAAAPPQAHPGYGQPAPRPQIAAQPAPRMDERVAARPAPPAVAAAEPPAASTFPPQSAGPPIAAAARQPAPNSAPPIAHLPPQNSPPTAAPAHPAMSNQRPLAPPAAQPGAAQQELPRVVSSRPVVVAQEYFEGPEVVSAAERPQPPPQSPSAPLQTPNGFVQGPAIQAAPGAPAAGYYPATGPLPDSRVGAGGASSARRIQNPAAVDEDEAEPDLDAPLPTATRPVGEYRAPSRY